MPPSDDTFDNRAALVVCRQLGFTSGSVVYQGNGTYSIMGGTGDILLEDVACNASVHTRIEQCPNRGGWRSHNCGHHQDVGVYCLGTAASTAASPHGLFGVVHSEVTDGLYASSMACSHVQGANGWGCLGVDLAPFTTAVATQTVQVVNSSFSNVTLSEDGPVDTGILEDFGSVLVRNSAAASSVSDTSSRLVVQVLQSTFTSSSGRVGGGLAVLSLANQVSTRPACYSWE